MKLVLPYPVSANRYWRTVVPKGGQFATTYPSEDAKRYKRQIRIAAFEQGCRRPIVGRVSVSIALYPERPQDWERRARRDPAGWDDSVRCLDLDNARKVLLDALNGVAFTDDSRIWRDAGARMEPDAEGARVIVEIEPIASGVVQPQLFVRGEPWPREEAA